MSEHSRYQRDRSARRDQGGDQGDGTSRARHPETRSEYTHDRQTLSDEDVWNRRHSDRDESYHSDQYHEDQHPRFDHGWYEPDFSRSHELDHEADLENNRQNDHHNNRENRATQHQDVWLKEKQSRITFNDADLQDIQFTERGDGAKKLAAYTAVAAMIGLIGLMIASITPDLSPQEIIAMEGYEGEQPIKTPFNLASLHDCEAGAECAETLLSTVTPITSKTTQTSATLASSQEPAVPVANSIIVASDYATPSDNASDYIEIQEIPAATVVLENTNTDASFNNRLTVLQQWSNVRGTPDIYGDILTSLAEGKTVTQIGQSGSWIEVQVDERPSVIGYMHRSTVAVQ